MCEMYLVHVLYIYVYSYTPIHTPSLYPYTAATSSLKLRESRSGGSETCWMPSGWSRGKICRYVYILYVYVYYCICVYYSMYMSVYKCVCIELDMFV